jgi:hypothetical protein
MGKRGLMDHFPDYCAKVCQDQWLTPCSGICKDDLKAVFDKCSGCKGGKSFCVNSPSNSEDDKKGFDWATRLPMAPKSCTEAPEREECVTYVVSECVSYNVCVCVCVCIHIEMWYIYHMYACMYVCMCVCIYVTEPPEKESALTRGDRTRPLYNSY